MTEEGRQRDFWTNPSVKALAPSGDPIAVMTEMAKLLVFGALEKGWQGPPFDPFWLAEHRGLSVVPRDDVPDARTVKSSNGRAVIEYNPNQPPARVRFSLAHEIGHTLFENYLEAPRNRTQLLQDHDDAWQLELLCNIAAAEILMPEGPFIREVEGEINIEKLMTVRKKYDVSPEAFLIRTARTTNQPIAIFAAARSSDEDRSEYRLDYCIASNSSPIKMASGLRIPEETVLKECVAIGFTARGIERWGGTEVVVECVGIPPFPGRVFPRVVGLLRPRDQNAIESSSITYLKGDITEPRGAGSRIVAHIINDKSSTWGAGAASAIAKRWPSAHSDFKNWSIARREEFDLGTIHEYEVSEGLWVISMVAQHGYGPSSKPRIRYAALRSCLELLARAASEHNASVHMPRIGTGFAGGNWKVIEDLVTEGLVSRGIKVIVYELPNNREKSQMYLDSAIATSA